MKNKGTNTRKMDVIHGELENKLNSLHCVEELATKLDAVRAASRSARPSKLKKLYQLLDKCGIVYEKGQNTAYYENLIYNSNIPTYDEVEDKILLVLFYMHKEFLSPQEYMKSMVDRLSFDEDGWQDDDALRLRILKQFVKYGNCLEDAGYGGGMVIRQYLKNKTGKDKISKSAVMNYLDILDNDVFAVLQTANKQQLTPNGKYGLLRICDDLSKGKFRTAAVSKQTLYFFAMVYHMTYSPNEEDRDNMTDVEKNLFEDYYINNLMRFISDDYNNRETRKYDIEPSGQGINYKNYAEMINLYFICSDHTPQEKIRLSSEMIDRVKKSQFNRGEVNVHTNETVFYEDLLTSEKLALTEAEFEKFICQNYDCDIFNGYITTTAGVVKPKNKNSLDLKTEQNSAVATYNKIIKYMQDEKIDYHYGLWFDQLYAQENTICERHPDIDKEQFKKFMSLLHAADNYIKKIYADSSLKSVTRTSIISAYYFKYNAEHLYEKPRTFEEVFNDFRVGVNSELEKAHYQKLSNKNIFDVLIVVSSYNYLLCDRPEEED